MAATESTQEWVTKLVDAVPRLRPMLQEHERFYEELLPHLFFGEVAPWAENELAAAGQSSDLLSLLSIVDEGYAMSLRHRSLRTLARSLQYLRC